MRCPWIDVVAEWYHVRSRIGVVIENRIVDVNEKYVDSIAVWVARNETRLTCLLKTAMSSLKDSDEQTSPPWTPGSLGVHVASSHFSNTIANSGNSGWLQKRKREKELSKLHKIFLFFAKGGYCTHRDEHTNAISLARTCHFSVCDDHDHDHERISILFDHFVMSRMTERLET